MAKHGEDGDESDGRPSAQPEPLDLGKLLDTHEDAVKRLGDELIGGDAARVRGAIAGLLSSLTTGSPLLAHWMNEGVRRAFEEPATIRLLREVRKYDREKSREAFVRSLRDEVELLIGQALIQSVRAQHDIKEELLEELGGLRVEFAEFRADLTARLSSEGAVAVRVDRLLVSGGIGVCISATARRRMRVSHACVSGGIGFKLE